MLDEQQVKEALKGVQDPELKKDLVDLGMIKDISVADGTVSLLLALTTIRCPRRKSMVEKIKRAVGSLPDVLAVDVRLTTLSLQEREKLFPVHPLVGIEKVKHTLAVASGKGGVGKTTVAVNVALALAKQGYKVGLLDADVYGPSVPLMLGVYGKPEMEHGMLVPVEKYGLKIMSFGMLLDEGQAVIWRGPLVARSIKQLLGEVMWGELDYLVVDLPPGTGDPSITIAQALPEIQVLMVTTPQEVALADVRRSIALFKKIKRPIVGFVENMAYFQAKGSAERIPVFGQGGGEKLSKETGLPLLGTIPIDLHISQSGDRGVPVIVAEPESAVARIFQDIASLCSEA